MKTLLGLVFAFGLGSVSAQSYAKVYKSSSNLTPMAISHSERNGVVIVGRNTDDAVAIKLDENGDIVWQKSWANPINLYPNFIVDQVIPVADSNFVFCGSIANESIMRRTGFLMKINKDGDMVWKQDIDQIGSSLDNHSTVIETPDSGYIMGWGAYHDGGTFALAKLDIDGNVLWTRTHANALPCNLVDIEMIDDSTYMLAGNLDLVAAPYYGGFLCGMDENGDLLWSKSYPGLFIDDVEISNGMLGLVGKNIQDNGLCFYALGDLNGNLSWNISPDPTVGDILLNTYNQIVALPDSSFVAYLCRENFPGFAYKINSAGDIVRSLELTQITTDLMRTNDNGLLFLGRGPLYGLKILYDDHIGAIRVDSTLTVQGCGWDYWPSPSSLYTPPADTMLWNNGANPTLEDQPIFTSTLDVVAQFSCVEVYGGLEEQGAALDFSIYPGISDGPFTIGSSENGISLYIYSANGQRIKGLSSVNDHEVISLHDCANGMYYYTAIAPDGRQISGKIILNR